MHPISLLVLLAGALSALAGVPFALAGDSLTLAQTMVQTPTLAPEICQADEVTGKHLNMTRLPVFFSSLAVPSLAADKTMAIYASKTTGLGHADSQSIRTGATNETILSTVPATSTQRIETSAAGLGVIALAVVLWL